MSDIYDLSSRNLGAGSSFRFTEALDRGPSIRSIGGIHRKAANQQYNPIDTPQEEIDEGRGGFPIKDGYRAEVNRTLAPGRVGKFGTDLLLEILLCGFAIGVSAPFIWLAITMARYDRKDVTEHDDDYIKQTTTTVCEALMFSSSTYAYGTGFHSLHNTIRSRSGLQSETLRHLPPRERH
jgi:hypothetical protein